MSGLREIFHSLEFVVTRGRGEGEEIVGKLVSSRKRKERGSRTDYPDQ